MRPCHCDKAECRLCYLFHNDPRYTALWAPAPTDIQASYLINLNRRPERLAQATERLDAAGIPFERVEAVDGKAIPIPSTWTVSAGGYGCLRSHLITLERAMAAGHRCIAVYEDDVQLADDYAAKLDQLIQDVTAVDPNWEAIMIGGQHVRTPRTTTNPDVLRCENVHRTHAYVVRGDYIKTLYQLWQGANKHVDAEWGPTQKQHRVYCPRHFLAYQGENDSDIDGRHHGLREWQPARVLGERMTHVAPKGGCRSCKDKSAAFAANMQPAVCHAGDVGDTLAALASFPNMGGQPYDLTLYHAPGTVREPYHPAKVDSLKTLLELQPYIRSVTYSDRPAGRILDGWRRTPGRGLNLADIFAKFVGVWNPGRHTPWLRVDRPERVAPVVVHRSPRYREASRFPWRLALKLYGDRAVFVGSPDEHAAFCREVGPLPYHSTPTYLDLARVIAGADLFVGNQSSPYWVALGLMRPTWLEQLRGRQGNCHWQRVNAWYDTETPNIKV